jgi:hypothetical protein
MTRRKSAKLVAGVIVLYIVFPFIAGLLAIGDRDGPKIYPRSYHAILYMISYETVRNEKPRRNIELERPWFYGFPRRRTRIYDQQ